MVAIHFMKIKEYTSAINFIVASIQVQPRGIWNGKGPLSNGIAADIIGTDTTNEDYLNIADYFEEAGNHFLAGNFSLKLNFMIRLSFVYTIFYM